jgi:hypothetical protein
MVRRISGHKWEEDCIMRNFIAFTLHGMLLGKQIKEDKIFGACSTHGRDEKFIQNVGRKSRKEETTRKT